MQARAASTILVSWLCLPGCNGERILVLERHIAELNQTIQQKNVEAARLGAQVETTRGELDEQRRLYAKIDAERRDVQERLSNTERQYNFTKGMLSSMVSRMERLISHIKGGFAGAPSGSPLDPADTSTGAATTPARQEQDTD